MEYTVGEVARRTGLTVRTLHHYDELRLVVPHRTAAGHRRYGPTHLERLQQVLFFRELGFALGAIGDIVADPGFDRRTALLNQRELVTGKLERLRRMQDAIDLALLAHDEGMTMDIDDMFGGFDPSEYEDEARERWGDTEAYAESERRTARYGKEEWQAISAEGEAITQRFADLKRAGIAADSAEAAAAAEEHRRHIDRWFYPLSPEMHVHLGEMYVADARFTAYWDAFEPGLAAYVGVAIATNAA